MSLAVAFSLLLPFLSLLQDRIRAGMIFKVFGMTLRVIKPIEGYQPVICSKFPHS